MVNDPRHVPKLRKKLSHWLAIAAPDMINIRYLDIVTNLRETMQYPPFNPQSTALTPLSHTLQTLLERNPSDPLNKMTKKMAIAKKTVNV